MAKKLIAIFLDLKLSLSGMGGIKLLSRLLHTRLMPKCQLS